MSDKSQFYLITELLKNKLKDRSSTFSRVLFFKEDA